MSTTAPASPPETDPLMLQALASGGVLPLEAVRAAEALGLVTIGGNSRAMTWWLTKQGDAAVAPLRPRRTSDA